MLRTPYAPVVAAEAASNFGSMLTRLAIPLLATLSLDATPWQMGLLLVADVAAGALAALLLGPAVDRRGKRAVMLACDGLRALVLAGLAAAALMQSLTLALLMVATAASAVLSMAFELARSAWMAQRLPAEDLSRANAALAAATSLSETAAFALGGWLFQAAGAVAALAIDAASYVASALCLRRVQESPPAPPSPHADSGALRAWWQESRDGLRALLSRPALRTLAAIEACTALATSLAGTSYMIFVARDIGFEPGLLGVVFAAGGLGALIGAGAAPRLGEQLGPARALVIGLAASAAGAALVPLVPAAGALGVALLVAQQIVGDGGHTLHEVHHRTLRQTLAEPQVLARVDAGIRFSGQLATLAGAIGGGALATATGARTALAIAAAVLAAAALLAALRLRD
ncbi:MAG: MFS transporter [Rubrivivax sp.]|nr:MFS transporter [Rubrivivax sp.]